MSGINRFLWALLLHHQTTLNCIDPMLLHSIHHFSPPERSIRVEYLTMSCRRKVTKKPAQEQLRIRKCNLFGHTLRSDDSFAKQALQWTSQGLRGTGPARNTWTEDLEKEMRRAGFKHSWRQMDAAAPDTVEWSVAYASLTVTWPRSINGLPLHQYITPSVYHHTTITPHHTTYTM